MVTVLDELELTELVTSLHGLSVVGAAAILAETDDPTWFATARAPTPPSVGGTPRLTFGASPTRHRGPPTYLAGHHGQPRPSSPQPDYPLSGTARFTALQGQTTDDAPAGCLTQTVSR